MNRSKNLFARIEKKHRVAVGDQDADHQSRLVGHHRVAFDTQEVRQVGIRLVEHQHAGPVYLLDGEQHMHGQIEGPGQRRAVALDVGTRIVGIESQVE